MFKKVILIFIFIAASKALIGEKATGYIISHKDDTLFVTFKIPLQNNTPDFEKLQWEIVYTDTNETSHVLTPEMAKEISFTINGTFYTLLSNKNTIGLRNEYYTKMDNVFLHLIKQGKVKLYNYYKSQMIGGMSSSGMTNPSAIGINKFIIQLETGEISKIKCIGFKKSAQKYFPNCPALIQKIKNNVLTCQQIELIVHEYNYGCTD